MKHGRKTWKPGRQTPKVKNGKVQKKHRWDYYFKEYQLREGDGEIPIVREPAIRGYRHVVSEEDLRRFIAIIPDWNRYSQGVRCLVLGDGSEECFGWHNEGVICINAWDDIDGAWDKDSFEEHRRVIDSLMVPYEEDESGDVVCHFTLKTAGAFQLMHVFLHELGHHYDRMMTKKKIHSPGEEPYAEDFGNKLADKMWTDFFRASST